MRSPMPTSVVFLALLASPAALPADDGLVWHVEDDSGGVLQSHAADVPINPASIVKAATTLWALEVLGPDHRFETRFATGDAASIADGELDGDLIVVGGGDPDFHLENASRVAGALNELGIRRVRGRLLVDGRFWIGWEGGSERRDPDPTARALGMARRLRDALDPRRWSAEDAAAMREFAERTGRGDGAWPAVEVLGGVALDGDRGGRLLLVHRSNPLRVALRRFNAYSNNDIERLADTLGGADRLRSYLRDRMGWPTDGFRVESLSGLGTGRLTPRQVVALVRELDRTCERLDLRLADVLPLAGCDVGTLNRFPTLATGAAAGAVVGKTGTLVTTDGGVSVIAGALYTAAGSRWFCIARPDNGSRLARARALQESRLLEMIAESGGPRPLPCGADLPHSDTAAEVIRPAGTGAGRGGGDG